MADTSTVRRSTAQRSSNQRDPECNDNGTNSHGNNGNGDRVPPNPCASTTKEGQNDCDCHKGNGAPPSSDEPKRPRPPKREDICCQQLIDILSRTPGIEVPKPHKPKQKPARKVGDLCRAFGVSDALIPLIIALWRRHEADEKPRNDFEKKIEVALSAIGAADAKAFNEGLKEYERLRRSGKAECLFDDCLADAASKGPVEGEWVSEIIMREGLKLGGQILFDHSEGEIGPGQVRLWDNKVFRGPNGSGATIYQGPWPWLTAISPRHDRDEEFGNTTSFRPVPGGAHVWLNYQYATECVFKPDPAGKLKAECARQHPPPPAPGDLLGTLCEGGQDYTRGNDCIRIPTAQPGTSIMLSGINYITPTVKVHCSKVGDPSVRWSTDCPVWGDRKTPLKDDTNHFIVDERVCDSLSFPLEAKHPTIPGAPLPAGLYEVWVEVENSTNVVYDSQVPPILLTNKLLLRIEADPNLKYNYFSNSGHCNRETPGMGDDEIWWDAFVGHIVPSDVAVSANERTPVDIRPLEQRSFPRGPWEDMDDGESAGAYSIDIWGPKPFEIGGVAAIGLVGFEVDSEDAAQQQIQGFGNAWWYALKSVVNIALGASGTAGSIAELAVKAGLIAAKAALTAVLIAVAVIAVITIIGTALWAAWAPADLIALDVLLLESTGAWDRTDPKRPLPPANGRTFGDPDDDDNIITVTERALPKDFKQGDFSAGWVQENQYDTPEDGEDASYTLLFRLVRTA